MKKDSSECKSWLGCFSDLTSGSDFNFQGGGVGMKDVDEKMLKALEEAAETFVATGEEAQVQFVKEVGQTG
jgi:hypothetical protein